MFALSIISGNLSLFRPAFKKFGSTGVYHRHRSSISTSVFFSLWLFHPNCDILEAYMGMFLHLHNYLHEVANNWIGILISNLILHWSSMFHMMLYLKLCVCEISAAQACSNQDRMTRLVIRNVQRWQNLPAAQVLPIPAPRTLVLHQIGVAFAMVSWSRQYQHCHWLSNCFVWWSFRKLSSERWSQSAQEMASWQSNALKIIHIGISDDSSVISDFWILHTL